MSTRKPPVCSHCLEEGHTKVSPICPLKGMPPAIKPEKEPPSNRWTAEKEELLLRIVANEPLQKDWDKISQEVGQSSSGCQKKYNELVDIDEQLTHNSSIISIENIKNAMEDTKTTCETCNITLYVPLYEWKGKMECISCYKIHNEEQESIWKEIMPFIRCVFCDRGRDAGASLHFDHINMFEKDDSVCSMVRRGADVSEIIQETNRCQILCNSCHAIVTKVEIMIGFTRAKSNLTRKANSAIKSVSDNDAEEQINAEKIETYAELYRKTIEPLYPLIKELVLQNNAGV